jgi:hypothetical protein
MNEQGADSFASTERSRSSGTAAQEAAMHHHHITHALAESHVADTQRTAAHNTPTASAHPRHRRHTMAAALITIGALAPAAGALAQPACDVGTSTNEHATAVARDQHPRATPGAITFTNPLGRSRGPGAGAGLL